MKRLALLIEQASAIAGNNRQLALHIGVSPGQLNNWKHGREPCADRHVIAMARITGENPLTVAMEVYRERLGELVKTLALGVVVMLCIGGNDLAWSAAGSVPTRDDVYYVN